jgi:putative transposase
MSLRHQCELLGLSRSGYYASLKPGVETEENENLMKLIDRQYLETPFYGSRRMTIWLQKQGYDVNRKRVMRLMRKMGLVGLAPGPNTSKPHPEHKVYPYLLRDMEVTRANQVWSTDITYIPMKRGFMYLTAVIDWYSRYVLSWELSNTMESGFCVTALEHALRHGKPEIFNTDQGSQFTSNDFTGLLLKNSIRISMDGRGRALDNIFVERLWRSLKYECVYLNDYENVSELSAGLRKWLSFYNEERPHTSLLGNVTPREMYESCLCL